MTNYYIRCNGARVHITPSTHGLPARLDGEWDGEQCEGCGDDIATTGRVVGPVERSGAAYVRCESCGSGYTVRRSEVLMPTEAS